MTLPDPKDTDVCVACDDTWAEHIDDEADAWKTDCPCCAAGTFHGAAVPIADLIPDEYQDDGA